MAGDSAGPAPRQGCYTDLAMSSSATHLATLAGQGWRRQAERDVPEAGVDPPLLSTGARG